MSWLRPLLLISTLIAWALGVHAEQEQKLAGIQLGMTKAEVVSLLGRPAGKMKPLPPINQMLDNPTAILTPATGGADQGPKPKNVPPAPNTLMFTNNLNNDESVMIGESTIVAAGASMGADMGMMGAADPMGAMMPPMPGGMGGEMGEPAKKVSLPAWAYYVRALYLEIGQEQLIYRVNDTYSIGVTVTKQGGGDYVVTDVVVASFEPLRNGWVFTGKNASSVNSSFPRGKRIDATSTRLDFTAKTSTGIRLGSRLNDVLMHQGWTEYCYPFVAGRIGKITGGNSVGAPVSYITFTRSGYVDTVSPTPDFYRGPAEAPGQKPTHLSDGVKELVSAGFTRNCLMLFPDDKVAYTLVDLVVVRIQIGDGVLTPKPPPPPPKVEMPSTPAGGAPGGGMPPPDGGGQPGGPPPPPPGGGGDVWF